MFWMKVMHKLFGCAYVWVRYKDGVWRLSRANELNDEWYADLGKGQYAKLGKDGAVNTILVSGWCPAMGGPEGPVKGKDDEAAT